MGKYEAGILIVGVLFLSGILAGWKLSAVPLDDHESYVSVTAREMLSGGSWIEPTFNGEPRLQKTPLSYWLVASIARVTGKVDEFAARMPSAVSHFCPPGWCWICESMAVAANRADSNGCLGDIDWVRSLVTFGET